MFENVISMRISLFLFDQTVVFLPLNRLIHDKKMKITFHKQWNCDSTHYSEEVYWFMDFFNSLSVEIFIESIRKTIVD
jgi:hypothetical protein